MTNNQKNAVVKSVSMTLVGQLAILPVSLYLNKKLDAKLAKSENPGRINRWTRWNLKLGRKPWWIVTSSLFSAACNGYSAYLLAEPIVLPQDNEEVQRRAAQNARLAQLFHHSHVTSSIRSLAGELRNVGFTVFMVQCYKAGMTHKQIFQAFQYLR